MDTPYSRAARVNHVNLRAVEEAGHTLGETHLEASHITRIPEPNPCHSQHMLLNTNNKHAVVGAVT